MDFLQPLAAVALVMALLGAALWVLRRRAPGVAPGREIKILERVTLGPQHALHLVRVGDRTLVVSTSPSSCALVTELNKC